MKISSFRRFAVRAKGLRMGCNPKTGEPAPILPRRVVAFRASVVQKRHINDAMAAAVTTRRWSGAVGNIGLPTIPSRLRWKEPWTGSMRTTLPRVS